MVNFGLLTLTRKEGEEIVIGSGKNAVVVTINRIDRTKVRVSVAAPRSVRVMRREIMGREAPRCA